jgi:hypothetical protein
VRENEGRSGAGSDLGAAERSCVGAGRGREDPRAAGTAGGDVIAGPTVVGASEGVSPAAGFAGCGSAAGNGVDAGGCCAGADPGAPVSLFDPPPQAVMTVMKTRTNNADGLVMLGLNPSRSPEHLLSGPAKSRKIPEQ